MWTARDLLLDGRFCPLEEVSQALEHARDRAAAYAALLLVADEGALLRSLCLCAPEEAPESRALLWALQRASADTKFRAPLHQLIFTGVAQSTGKDPAGSTSDALVDRLLRPVYAFTTRYGLPEAALAVSHTASWLPARRPPELDNARIRATVLFFCPGREAVAQDAGGSNWVAVDAEMIELFERLNGTAHASVRRDTRTMARLDDQLHPADYVSGRIDFSSAAHSLVRLAVELSSSDVGACYLLHQGSKTMRLAAPFIPDALAADRAYPKTLPLTSHALAVRSGGLHQTLQMPPGIPSERKLEYTSQPLDGTDVDSLELATPVAGPLASPRAPAVGALTIGRIGADARPFDAYELALIRNVALRIALINSTTNTERAARLFTRLSIGADRARSGAVEGEQRPEAFDEEAGPIPDDLAAALPAITDGLHTLAEVTGSHSATFRAVLPHRDAAPPHGVALVRVAWYPLESAHPPGSAVQLTGGVNWGVAISGQPAYVPVVRDDPRYLQRRADTRSELCVPVFVEERVVGVINLESPVTHAYDAQIATAQAVSEHVGLVIANARIAISTALQAHAIEIVRRGHTLRDDYLKLRQLAATMSSIERAAIEKVAAAVERKALGLRGPEVHPAEVQPFPDEATMPELLKAAIARAKLEFVEIEVPDHLNWTAYPRGTSADILHALRDLLTNVKRHRVTGDTARFTLAQAVWGGRHEDVLTVQNRAGRVLKASRAINAYRTPLAGSAPRWRAPATGTGEVPQLGAYLAGTLARRVGGDVHLCYLDVNVARITLSLPRAN